MPISTEDQFQTIYRKDPSIVTREIDGEMILVPIRKSVGDLDSIYVLNETAMFAWQLVNGEHSLEEIRQEITNAFDVDEQQAGLDLVELVAQLQKMGALVKV